MANKFKTKQLSSKIYHFARGATFTFFLSAYLIGCSATKTYPGPERPREQLARLNIGAEDVQVVNVYQLLLDQKEYSYFTLGLNVLPGRHTAGARFSTNDGVCADARRDEHCHEPTYNGKCQVDFVAEAGQNYSVRIKGGGRYTSIRVVNTDSGRWVASGSCQTK